MHPVVSAIHDMARYNPGRVALRWKCLDFPYAAVQRQISTRALAMQLKGVRAGDIVAFAANRGPETIMESAALWVLGAGGLPLPHDSGEPMPAHSILGQATGFMHADGDYLKAVGPAAQAGKSSGVWLFDGGFGAGTMAMGRQEFSDVLEGAAKRFSLATRTVLGTTRVDLPGSLLDVWSVLAAGGTVDLIDHFDSLSPECLRQHLRETEADLLVVPDTLPRRLSGVGRSVFAQFRDVVVVDSFDQHSRTVLADAFPCAIFHFWNPSTDLEQMSDCSPADFVGGNDYQAKDPHA